MTKDEECYLSKETYSCSIGTFVFVKVNKSTEETINLCSLKLCALLTNTSKVLVMLGPQSPLNYYHIHISTQNTQVTDECSSIDEL